MTIGWILQATTIQTVHCIAGLFHAMVGGALALVLDTVITNVAIEIRHRYIFKWMNRICSNQRVTHIGDGSVECGAGL